MQSAIIALLVVYMVLVVALLGRLTRHFESLKSFFLADRKLGPWPIALSFVAAWFGAGSMMESLNVIHQNGVSGAFKIIAPSILSCLVITFLFARRVVENGCLTLPEAVERAYGPVGRLFLMLTIVASGITFIGGEMVAGSRMFESVLGWSFPVALMGLSCFVVVYSIVGGFTAVVLTDMLQCALFSLSQFLVAGVAIWLLTQNPATVSALTYETQPDFWHWNKDIWANLCLIVTFVLGWSIAPEMWQRMAASKAPALARQSAGIATIILAGLFGLIFFTGIISIAVPIDPDNVLLSMAQQLPTWLGALVVVGFLAAVASTMDSSINVGSLNLTHDLYHRFIRPNAGGKELVLVSRVSLVVMAGLAAWVALQFQSILQVLWISSDILACTMFIPITAMLLQKQPSRMAGLCAMGFGGVVLLFSAAVQYHWIAWTPVGWPGWPYSTLIGVVASGTGYCLGWLWERLLSASKSLPA